MKVELETGDIYLKKTGRLPEGKFDIRERPRNGDFIINPLMEAGPPIQVNSLERLLDSVQDDELKKEILVEFV